MARKTSSGSSFFANLYDKTQAKVRGVTGAGAGGPDTLSLVAIGAWSWRLAWALLGVLLAGPSAESVLVPVAAELAWARPVVAVLADLAGALADILAPAAA